MKNARSIIIRPLVTEKGSQIREQENKYLFSVAMTANKIEIKRAVEEIFNVKVKSVKTATVHGKVKRLGVYEGKRPDWKKAVVTLEAGQTIDLFEQV
ncbi:MAG: 50S ribosomal protein L23 [bacterium]